MTDPAPRCPAWAIEGGIPAPDPGEGYRAYWTRVGALEDVIDWSLQVRPAAADCANDRMGTWLRLCKPGLFLQATDRMAYRGRVPIRKIDSVRA